MEHPSVIGAMALPSVGSRNLSLYAGSVLSCLAFLPEIQKREKIANIAFWFFSKQKAGELELALARTVTDIDSESGADVPDSVTIRQMASNAEADSESEQPRLPVRQGRCTWGFRWLGWTGS